MSQIATCGVMYSFIHRCNSLCYVWLSGLLHRVADSLRIVQHSVAKRFMYCKHNITLWNTQAISQKVVTFFEKVKIWSHLSLFVWDWICRARRIASNFTRFYGVAKCVTAGIWQDSHPKTHQLLTRWKRKENRKFCSLSPWIRRGSNPGPQH